MDTTKEKVISLDNLIRALQIFRKYGNLTYPTTCQHDELYVQIDPSLVSKEDITELESFGFSWNKETDNFISFAYGS